MTDIDSLIDRVSELEIALTLLERRAVLLERPICGKAGPDDRAYLDALAQKRADAAAKRREYARRWRAKKKVKRAADV